MSLIILNNQGDGGLPNVPLEHWVINQGDGGLPNVQVEHLEHHNVQGVVTDEHNMEECTENNEAAEAIEQPEDLVIENDEAAFEQQEQLAGYFSSISIDCRDGK